MFSCFFSSRSGALLYTTHSYDFTFFTPSGILLLVGFVVWHGCAVMVVVVFVPGDMRAARWRGRWYWTLWGDARSANLMGGGGGGRVEGERNERNEGRSLFVCCALSWETIYVQNTQMQVVGYRKTDIYFINEYHFTNRENQQQPNTQQFCLNIFFPLRVFAFYIVRSVYNILYIHIHMCEKSLHLFMKFSLNTLGKSGAGWLWLWGTQRPHHPIV